MCFINGRSWKSAYVKVLLGGPEAWSEDRDVVSVLLEEIKSVHKRMNTLVLKANPCNYCICDQCNKVAKHS